MKVKQITDYEMYYYFSAIEQYMLEQVDDKFFVANIFNDKFYNALKGFVIHLYDDNCYPIRCINKLKELLKKICDKVNEEWYIKYQILYQFLERDDWIDSNQYLIDTKNKYHGSLKEGLENKNYSKEELEQELSQTFNYLDLILNEKLTKQNKEVFEQQNFITFVKILLQEGASIIKNPKYKKQLVDCLNMIIKDNVDLKKQAQYILYQIKTGIYSNLSYMFYYDCFVDIVKSEYIKKCFLNPDIKSLDSIFTKEQLYSSDFKQEIEFLIDCIYNVKTNSDEILYGYHVKNKLLSYLSDYDSFIRDNDSVNKDEIEWVNEQKIRINSLPISKIANYIINDIYTGFSSLKEAFDLRKSNVEEEFSILFYSDIQYLNSLLLDNEQFISVKNDVVKNSYILSSIYKYLFCLDEIYVDPTIYERTMDLINESLKLDNSLANKVKGSKIKKKLSNYYEEKSYERV